MSRAPEDVSKLTESTYKVSEVTKQVRLRIFNTGQVAYYPDL